MPANFFQKLVSWCCLFFLVLLFACSSRKPENKSLEYASLSDSTYYVGIQTCKSCHGDIYETFIRTGMGKSFDMASKEKSSAVFASNTIIDDTYRNLLYHPHWQGDSLYLKEFRLNGHDTIFSRDEMIKYIVGSGQHTNSHIIETNGYLYQAPATYYTQRAVWDLPPGFEHGANTRFGRKIELECMSCHNAYPQMVEGSENKYSFVANGIDCERCHGPGSKHVQEKRKGNLIDITQNTDYSIVNPAKLPIALQLDICQRCHIQGNAVLNEGKSFFDFRPGMHLSQVMNVFMPVYKGQENEHIMASHAERLKMSQCYIVSVQHAEKMNTGKELMPYKNAMTCVTCHNPHVSVKETGSDIYNKACTNCHSKSDVHATTALAKTTCTETPARRAAVMDNCVSCHMPKNSTIDIPHVSTTDHFIRKPVAPEQVQKIKEFVGIACINNAGADKITRGKAYLSFYEKFVHNKVYLDSAKALITDATAADVKANFNSLVRWAYLKEDYRQVITYANQAGDIAALLSTKDFANDDAWTAYRIGEAFSQTRMDNKALFFFDKAVQLAPFIPEFRNKLGSSQVINKDFDKAKTNFELLIRENPGYAEAYINLGYLTLTVFRNVEAADGLYEKALKLDPDNVQALLNRAGTQVFLNKPKEARKLLQQVLVVDPSNNRAKQLIKAL
jgi:hypothetical protein